MKNKKVRLIFLLGFVVAGLIYLEFNSLETTTFNNTNTEAADYSIKNEKKALLKKRVVNYESSKELVIYDGAVEHIFFHPLIAYPELAFDNDSMAKGYDDWFVTVEEFNRILTSLYKNNYVLIDINSLYEIKAEADGKKVLVKKDLVLPKNKKPIIISIDDLNYYEYMRVNGNVHKLIIDEQGNIATFSLSPAGKENIAYDNEIIPILEEFINKHRDFSYNGARGIIALTGYEGILGYRTDLIDSPDFEKEKKNALAVVDKLKETGWDFASHGYGHLDSNKAGYNRLVNDTLRWKEEVESLLGSTDIYIYPYGSRLEEDDKKFKYLIESGFNVFLSVGPKPYIRYNSNYLLMDRRHIDGIAFKTQRDKLLNLFDSKEVIDYVRP